MKKRLTVVLTMLLAFVLCFSFVGCKNDNRGMTQAKWEEAFAKSSTLTNRTETMGYAINMELKYNGATITAETDLGNGMTGADLFEALDIEEANSMDVKAEFFIDSKNGKANAVSSMAFGAYNSTQTEYYRVNGEKLEYSYSYGEDSAYKEVYGPYKDAATAQSVLVSLSNLQENIGNMNIATEDGKTLNILKDYNKFSYSKGVYSAKVAMDMDNFELPGKGKGTVTVKLNDGYVSDVKLTLNNSMSIKDALDDEDIPEGVTIPDGITMEMTVVAGAGVTNVGNTVVSDEGLVEAPEENTEEYAVVNSETQFKAMFPSLEDGIQLEYSVYNEDDEGTNYTVEVRKTANGYEAYVRMSSNGENQSYFYIATESGIAKYEGKYEDGIFQEWGEPTQLTGSGTLEALSALLPETAQYYFATYDGGKTISELFDKFGYVEPDVLGANFKSGNKTVKVKIDFSYSGSDIKLYRISFDNVRVYVYGNIGNLEHNRPDAE